MDDPVTDAALAPLPEWVRWNGEQAGLPAHLIERAVPAALTWRAWLLAASGAKPGGSYIFGILPPGRPVPAQL